MTTSIYLEGGGDSKELHIRCREGFRKLLESCGFEGKMPRLYACGGRKATFDDFKKGHVTQKTIDYVAMLIDSEDPLNDLEAAWVHLKRRDGWEKPTGADDHQVLFMTTCMETWIVADRRTLAEHYGNKFQESALPSLVDLEKRSRQEIQNKLIDATRNCPNVYEKGKRSFEILGKLSPDALGKHLPSFVRVKRILDERLKE